MSVASIVRPVNPVEWASDLSCPATPHPGLGGSGTRGEAPKTVRPSYSMGTGGSRVENLSGSSTTAPRKVRTVVPGPPVRGRLCPEVPVDPCLMVKPKPILRKTPSTGRELLGPTQSLSLPRPLSVKTGTTLGDRATPRPRRPSPPFPVHTGVETWGETHHNPRGWGVDRGCERGGVTGTQSGVRVRREKTSFPPPPHLSTVVGTGHSSKCPAGGDWGVGGQN